jgi:hypothetical protein
MIRHTVPTSTLIHIGDMTVSFALLEAQIRALAGSLIKEDLYTISILTNAPSFRQLRAATLALYKHRHGDDNDCKTLQALITQAGKIEEERNTITHSLWSIGDQPNEIRRVKAAPEKAKGFQFKVETYDDKRLKAFVDEIMTLIDQFLRFQGDLLRQGKVIATPTEKTW